MLLFITTKKRCHNQFEFVIVSFMRSTCTNISPLTRIVTPSTPYTHILASKSGENMANTSHGNLSYSLWCRIEVFVVYVLLVRNEWLREYASEETKKFRVMYRYKQHWRFDVLLQLAFLRLEHYFHIIRMWKRKLSTSIDGIIQAVVQQMQRDIRFHHLRFFGGVCFLSFAATWLCLCFNVAYLSPTSETKNVPDNNYTLTQIHTHTVVLFLVDLSTYDKCMNVIQVSARMAKNNKAAHSGLLLLRI